ncbi:MAG: hypothetical protein Q4D03_07420 [Bacteroidales bacterium]|nr:hypothetical protein [Bacteroidales bacterium]
MLNFETKLSSIEYKVRKLIDENRQMKEQIIRLNNQRDELKEQVRNQEKEINNLKENIKVLKLRNALEQKGDSTEVKLRINQMIRTVDRCLSILNKTPQAMAEPAKDNNDSVSQKEENK